MPMPAFMVFIREKTLDQPELEAYWAKTRATLEGHPIKILAAYGRHVTLEGPEVEGVVIAEFPTLEAVPRLVRQPGLSGSRPTPISRSDLSRPDCRRCLISFLEPTLTGVHGMKLILSVAVP